MKPKVLITATIALLVLASPLVAHHGSAAYDITKQVTVKGVVTQWFWANPHCLLKFDVKDDSGNVAHWVVEVSNPNDMFKKGWSKDSFKPGDQVTVSSYQAQNGAPNGRATKIVLPNGQVFIGMEGTGAYTGKPFQGNDGQQPQQPR